MQLSCTWTVSERVKGLWVPKLTRKNIFTNYGLSALASAPAGNYVAPIYLAVESFFAELNAAIGIGATSFSVNSRVDQAGDTQVVIDAGLSTQETLTFTSVAGSTAPFTYTLSTPTTFAHAANAKVYRQVSASDTLANLTAEVSYDPINAPGQRLASAAGFSSGVGEYSIQFYYTSTMAVAFFATCGLTDSPTIGAGNLHNHFVLGYDHTADTNDVQINGNITITNA